MKYAAAATAPAAGRVSTQAATIFPAPSERLTVDALVPALSVSVAAMTTQSACVCRPEERQERPCGFVARKSERGLSFGLRDYRRTVEQ